MPKKSSSKRDTVRFSLDLSPAMNDLITELASSMGVSKSDVLRRSLALLEAAVDAREHGNHVGSVEGDNREKLDREFIFM